MTEVYAGRLQVSALRIALGQRARWSEGRLDPRVPQLAPEAKRLSGGRLRVVADNVA